MRYYVNGSLVNPNGVPFPGAGIGSGLARAAWGGFMRAADEIARDGRFDAFAENRPFDEINGFFRNDLKARR